MQKPKQHCCRKNFNLRSKCAAERGDMPISRGNKSYE